MSYLFETSEGPYWTWWANERNPDGSKGARVKLNTDALGRQFTPEELKEHLQRAFSNLDFSEFECQQCETKPPVKGVVPSEYFSNGIIDPQTGKPWMVSKRRKLINKKGKRNVNTNLSKKHGGGAAQRLRNGFSGFSNRGIAGRGGYDPRRH